MEEGRCRARTAEVPWSLAEHVVGGKAAFRAAPAQLFRLAHTAIPVAPMMHARFRGHAPMKPFCPEDQSLMMAAPISAEEAALAYIRR